MKSKKPKIDPHGYSGGAPATLPPHLWPGHIDPCYNDPRQIGQAWCAHRLATPHFRLVAFTVTNLTDQPNCVLIGSHAAAWDFLERAAAKYKV